MRGATTSEIPTQRCTEIARCENAAACRPLGALAYVPAGPVTDGLVAVENLVLVVLHDEAYRPGRAAVRLAGFTGRRVPWGVRWGGRQASRFFEAFSRNGSFDGRRRRRLDSADAELLRWGRALSGLVDRHLARRWLPVRRSPLLPRLWAAFRPETAGSSDGDGPELAAASRRRNQPADAILRSARRDWNGLALYPLDWVSHRWEEAAAVLADLDGLPRRQVFAVQDFPEDLQGYHGAAAYDFFHSRFRYMRRSGRRPSASTGSARADASRCGFFGRSKASGRGNGKRKRQINVLSTASSERKV